LAGTAGEFNADVLAKEIRSDLIEPELRKIGDRLRTERASLVRKIGVSVGVGTFSTVCGLMFGPPGYSAGAIGAVLGVRSIGSALDKYIERTGDIALSDMYFLWKAPRHRHH
jgi:hypothetical protein